MSTTITIRIDPKTKERLEKLAQATDRSMSYFVSHALEQVIEQEEWQIGEIKRRVELADKPGATFIPHEDIEAWLKSWGTKKERKPPKCV
ncbi:MAG: ribbon-helix-helix protein, CopG family [Nitrospirae bacterium]|nr:MAG: ribbon-helix-helix protein, CopG family [Nitrospirota bacterium]